MSTTAPIRAAPMPDAPTPTPRHWWAFDPLNVLAFCLFVAVVEAIAGISYYRRHVAMIPQIGAAARMSVQAPACDMPCESCDETDEMTTEPPTRETPETLP